jgi:hypothetical protein
MLYFRVGGKREGMGKISKQEEAELKLLSCPALGCTQLFIRL